MPIPATFQLPETAESSNMAALAALKVERFTSSTASVITLNNTAVEGLEQVFKNGTLLDPNPGTVYFLAGNTLTLGTALIASDVLIVRYYYRPAR